MVLETLYCGDICPVEQAVPQDKEYRKMKKKTGQLLDELSEKLTKEQMELVNNFHMHLIKTNCMELEAQFQYGFALGMLLMKDVYELPFLDKKME